MYVLIKINVLSTACFSKDKRKCIGLGKEDLNAV